MKTAFPLQQVQFALALVQQDEGRVRGCNLFCLLVFSPFLEKQTRLSFTFVFTSLQ